MIKSIEGFISTEYSNKILSHTLSYEDSEWSLMNEEHINGPFWNNKRMMIDLEIVSELQDRVAKEVGLEYRLTAVNKAQRFYSKDVLGPLVDALHVPSIKYGIALFLDDKAGGIRFPKSSIAEYSKPGKLIIYSSDEEYEIFVDQNEEVMHFMTFFADEV